LPASFVVPVVTHKVWHILRTLLLAWGQRVIMDPLNTCDLRLNLNTSENSISPFTCGAFQLKCLRENAFKRHKFHIDHIQQQKPGGRRLLLKCFCGCPRSTCRELKNAVPNWFLLQPQEGKGGQCTYHSQWTCLLTLLLELGQKQKRVASARRSVAFWFCNWQHARV